MKVGIYTVSWWYNDKVARTRRIITCYIFADDKLVANGSCECSPSDTYNKDMGRKISLARALDERKNGHNYKFDKKARSEFWEKYRTLTRVPRWGTQR